MVIYIRTYTQWSRSVENIGGQKALAWTGKAVPLPPCGAGGSTPEKF